MPSTNDGFDSYACFSLCMLASVIIPLLLCPPCVVTVMILWCCTSNFEMELLDHLSFCCICLKKKSVTNVADPSQNQKKSSENNCPIATSVIILSFLTFMIPIVGQIFAIYVFCILLNGSN